MLPTKAPAVDSAAVRQLKIAYLETPLAPKPDPLYANQRDLFLRKAARNAQGNAEGNAKGNDDDPGLGLGGGGSGGGGRGYFDEPLAPRRSAYKDELSPNPNPGGQQRKKQPPVRHFAVMSMLPFWEHQSAPLPTSPINTAAQQASGGSSSGRPVGGRSSSRPGSSSSSSSSSSTSRPGSRARSAGGSAMSAAERAKQLEAAKLGIEYEPEVQVSTEYELGVQLSGQAIMPLLPRSPTAATTGTDGEDAAGGGGGGGVGGERPSTSAGGLSVGSVPLLLPSRKSLLDPRPSSGASRSSAALPLTKLYVRQNPRHAAAFGRPAPSGPAADESAAKLYRIGTVRKYTPDIDSPYMPKPKPKPRAEAAAHAAAYATGRGPSSRSARSGGSVRPHSRAALIPTPRHVKKHTFVDVVTRRVMKPEPKEDPRWQKTWEWDPVAPPKSRSPETLR